MIQPSSCQAWYNVKQKALPKLRLSYMEGKDNLEPSLIQCDTKLIPCWNKDEGAKLKLNSPSKERVELSSTQGQAILEQWSSQAKFKQKLRQAHGDVLKLSSLQIQYNMTRKPAHVPKPDSRQAKAKLNPSLSCTAGAKLNKVNKLSSRSQTQAYKLRLTRPSYAEATASQYNLNLSSTRGWANLKPRSGKTHANLKPISSQANSA